MSHTVSSKMQPGVMVTISDAEYELWLELGIVYEGEPIPDTTSYLDAQIAELVDREESATRAELRALMGADAGGLNDGVVSTLVTGPSTTAAALRAASVAVVDEEDFAPTGAWDFTGATVTGIAGSGSSPPAPMLTKIAKTQSGVFNVMLVGTSIASFDTAPGQVLVESLKTLYGDTSALHLRGGALGGSFTAAYQGWDKQRFGGPTLTRSRGNSASTPLTFQFYGDTLTLEFSRETDSAAANISIDGSVVGTTPAAGAQAYAQKQTFSTTAGTHTVTIGVPSGAGYVYFEHLAAALSTRAGVDFRDETLGGSTLGAMVNVAAASAPQVTSLPIVGDNGLDAYFNRTDVDLFVVSYVVNDAGSNPLGSYFATVYKPAIDKVVAKTAANGAQLCLVVEMAGHYAMPNDSGSSSRNAQFNQIHNYLLTLGQTYNHVTVVDHHGATAMSDIAAYAARYYPTVTGLNVAAGTFTSGDFIHSPQGPGPQAGVALIHKAAGIPEPARDLASLVKFDRYRTLPGTQGKDQRVTISGTAKRYPQAAGMAVLVKAVQGGLSQYALTPYYRDPSPTNLLAAYQANIDASVTSDQYGKYLDHSNVNMFLGSAIDWVSGLKRMLSFRASGTISIRANAPATFYADGQAMPQTDTVNGRTTINLTTPDSAPVVISVVLGATGTGSYLTVSGRLYDIALVDSDYPVLTAEASAGAQGLTGATGPAGGVGAPLVSGRWSLATLFGSVTSVTLTLGRAYAVPIVFLNSGTVDQVGVDFTTAVAGCLVRLGLYGNDATNGRPGTLLGDAGQVDGSTTGFKSASLPSPVAVTAGQLYWLACCSQGSAAAQVRAVTGVSPMLSVDNTQQTGPTVYRYTLDTTSGLLSAWPSNWLIDSPGVHLRAHAV